MAKCGASKRDVREALITGFSATFEASSGRWVVIGYDFDGDELTVVLVIADGLVIVTAS
jgi:hypothetical protein